MARTSSASPRSRPALQRGQLAAGLGGAAGERGHAVGPVLVVGRRGPGPAPSRRRPARSACGARSAASWSASASSEASRAASASSVAMTAWSTKAPRSRSTPRRRSVSTASRPRARSRRLSKRTRASPRSSPPTWPSWDSAAITDGVERGEGAAQQRLLVGQLGPGGAAVGQAPAQRGELASGEEQVQRPQLGDEVAVPAGGVGLALERAQLAAHLAQEVAEPGEVALGGGEAALGLLLALAELQDAGGLLDDEAAVLGPGVEHGVDLALARRSRAAGGRRRCRRAAPARRGDGRARR